MSTAFEAPENWGPHVADHAPTSARGDWHARAGFMFAHRFAPRPEGALQSFVDMANAGAPRGGVVKGLRANSESPAASIGVMLCTSPAALRGAELKAELRPDRAPESLAAK